MFCPKCGSILLPKKEGNKKILACSCGFKNKDTSNSMIKEEKLEKRKAEVNLETAKKLKKIASNTSEGDLVPQQKPDPDTKPKKEDKS